MTSDGGFTALVPVGGEATRLRPLTSAVPKALLPLGPVTLMDRVLSELTGAGAARVVVVVSAEQSRLVPRHLDLTRAARPDVPAVEIQDVGPTSGIAEAVLALRGEFGAADVVVVAFPDEVVGGSALVSRLVGTARRTGMHAAAVVPGAGAELPELFQLGDVAPDGGSGTAGGAAPKAPRVVGRYCVHRDFLDDLDGAYRDGARVLTPALAAAARRGRVAGVRHDGPYHDVGTLDAYVAATRSGAGA